MSGKPLMVQGTGSGVGKSLLVTALCRILLQDGYRVAPFKAQNMALNSYVTRDGGEIGRAQAVQAQACRLEPMVDMNPILIKPTTDLGAQIIVRGRPAGNMSISEFKEFKKQAMETVWEAYQRLINHFDVVILEGAGSPAEINLKDQDIVNMKMATLADAPVILVGDIDKGGVFAWLVGTMELLSPDERARVKGFVINKFRGDIHLLTPGLEFLERRTGKRVLGVVPYHKGIRIPEEDSLVHYRTDHEPALPDERINIAILHLPRMSNFTDFDAFRSEIDANVWYVQQPHQLSAADIILIPGTKSTISDLKYLYASGIAQDIKEAHRRGKLIIGICGGYQIMGTKILDPEHVESNDGEIQGLGLLNIITKYHSRKSTLQVAAKHMDTGIRVEGYEIHHGEMELHEGALPVFEILDPALPDRASRIDGASSEDHLAWGTNIHGLFDNDAFRSHLMNLIRVKKGIPFPPSPRIHFDQDEEYNKLADAVRAHVDMDTMYRIIGKVAK